MQKVSSHWVALQGSEAPPAPLAILPVAKITICPSAADPQVSRGLPRSAQSRTAVVQLPKPQISRHLSIRLGAYPPQPCPT